MYVVNTGTYGGSFTENSMKLSLLRTPVYAAHPIESRPIAPHDRALEHIDIGERTFRFRITSEADIDRQAQLVNEAPQVMSFFPSGDGAAVPAAVTASGTSILVSSVKKQENGYLVTLYNTTAAQAETQLRLHSGKTVHDTLRPHELKQILL